MTTWADLLVVDKPTREETRRQQDERREHSLAEASEHRPDEKTVARWLDILAGDQRLSQVLKGMSAWTGINWARQQDSDAMPDDTIPVHGDRKPVKRLIDAEAVGSKLRSASWAGEVGHQILALDIDHHAWLIPSTQDGHYHLIIGHAIPDEDWRKVITVLGEVGIIQEGFVGASLARGETFLRLPWIRKGTEREDHAAAMNEYLVAEDDSIWSVLT